MMTPKNFLLTQFFSISLFSRNLLIVNNNLDFVTNGISTFTDLYVAKDYAQLPDSFSSTDNYTLSKLKKTEETNNVQLDVKNGGTLLCVEERKY